ncbi:MAG TPA: methyltransferase [Bacteroidales bacterium]|nr:methyltransferase [Bacteroidales bacterium]
MPNDYFSFKQFTIQQDRCAFKVGTDGVLLGAYADITGAGRILDIGSGTGLIAIMLAQRSNADIFALEPDAESYSQLTDNIEACLWKERIHGVNCSVQDYDPGYKFGLIVSNPPYFINSVRNPDGRKSGARHNDNLPHEELLKSVTGLLEENGRFQVIMPFAEGNVLIAEAAAYGLYCNEILKIKPLPSSEIRRLIMTFRRQKEKASEKFLTIEHGPRHEFTEDYRALTKDFYLRF